MSRTQDTTAVLPVLYSAAESYGPPERLVTDGGGIFKAKQSRAVYRVLGIEKKQIERRKPYESYMQTTFGTQKRMGDWRFAKAETFADLAAAHDTWRQYYNAQRPWAPRAETTALAPAGCTRLLHRPLASPRRGPQARLLLDPSCPGTGCPGLRQVPRPEALRRGDAGHEGGRRMATTGGLTSSTAARCSVLTTSRSRGGPASRKRCMARDPSRP